MSHITKITFASLLGLANAQSAYQLGFSWLFGMTVWISFFAGTIAFRALPRQMFATLQYNIFPVFFTLTLVLSSSLIALWTYSHPIVLEKYLEPSIPEVAQVWALGTVFVTGLINRIYSIPNIQFLAFERFRLEKEEGKSHTDATISDKFKAVNTKFRAMHVISSSTNLTALLALVFHGLWIGTAGTHIKSIL